MTLEMFLQKLKDTPDKIEFSGTMGVVDAMYVFTPTSFKNGDNVVGVKKRVKKWGW